MASPVDRRVLGSWLEGPRAAAQAQGVVFPERGARLGMPADGPGSVARAGRRLVALAIDWLAANLVVLALGARGGSASWLALIVFFGLTSVTLALTGRTFGHAAMRLQLVDVRPRGLQPVRVVLRQLLICLVVPACMWDADGRGLHDKAAGTALVRA